MINKLLSSAGAALGKIGGSKTSERKAQAVRANGRKGGRVAQWRLTRILEEINLRDLMGRHGITGEGAMTTCPWCHKNYLSISDDRQVYHCFSCGAGGSAIKFVCDMTGKNFIEAIRYLEAQITTDPDFEGIAAALSDVSPSAMLQWNKSLSNLRDIVDQTQWTPGVTENSDPKWTISKAAKLKKHLSQIPFVVDDT
jgi:hypothetical protein